jgi:hypothetical protein
LNADEGSIPEDSVMKTVRVYRNPECPKCAPHARWHERLDWLNRVQISARTPAGRRPLRFGDVIVADLRDGHLLEGAEGFARLAQQVPAVWPILALLPIAAVRKRVDREMRGACDDSCELPT